MSRYAVKLVRRLAPAALAAAGALAGTGCCCTGGGGYGSYYGAQPGGCDSGACNPGYGANYGAPVYPQGAMVAPAGPTAAAPVYYQTASAPVIMSAPVTQTAAAPVNCVPTY